MSWKCWCHIMGCTGGNSKPYFSLKTGLSFCKTFWLLSQTPIFCQPTTLFCSNPKGRVKKEREWKNAEELKKQTLRQRVNPISLSYPFPFVLPLALVPQDRVVSARGENIPLWNETPLGHCYVIIHHRWLAATSPEATSVDRKLSV